VPVIESRYLCPWYLRNGHIHSISAALFRKVGDLSFSRERIKTPDDDFLDIDWVRNPSRRIVLLIHGLEASSNSSYIRGMTKALSEKRFSVAAMNLRGCSGEMNQQLRAYHSGATDDVDTVVNHILKSNACDELMLIGFSLGGNLVLKYLGEKGTTLPHQIKKAVTVSVPCSLAACADKLDQRVSFIYRNRFLKTLKQKAASRIHSHQFKQTEEKILSAKTLREYDDYFTAPLFGFKDASDYYRQCSSAQFIKHISVPTLILTSQDDPFFTADCLPFDECRDHPNVFLEAPEHGGHVGFIGDVPWGKYYSEERALEWLIQ